MNDARRCAIWPDPRLRSRSRVLEIYSRGVDRQSRMGLIFCQITFDRLLLLQKVYIMHSLPLAMYHFIIVGRPFVKRFAVCYRSVIYLLSCNGVVLWPNGWMDQDETWHGGRPWSRPDCVRWGPSSPHPKGHSPTLFGTCLLWQNSWLDQDATWYGGRPWSQATLCCMGTHLPPKMREKQPFTFRRMYCGQTAWMDQDTWPVD